MSANDITGLFVFHAERIKETSNDAFIINLYRDNNNWGFIKAFLMIQNPLVGLPVSYQVEAFTIVKCFCGPGFMLPFHSLST